MSKVLVKKSHLISELCRKIRRDCMKNACHSTVRENMCVKTEESKWKHGFIRISFCYIGYIKRDSMKASRLCRLKYLSAEKWMCTAFILSPRAYLLVRELPWLLKQQKFSSGMKYFTFSVIHNQRWWNPFFIIKLRIQIYVYIIIYINSLQSYWVLNILTLYDIQHK